VVGASDEPGILAAAMHADGSHREILCVPGRTEHGALEGSAFLKMDGQAVFKLAVKVLEQVAQEVLTAAKLTPADIDWLIPHQANIRIMEGTAKKIRHRFGSCGRDCSRSRQHIGSINSIGTRYSDSCRPNQAWTTSVDGRRGWWFHLGCCSR